MSDRGAIHWPLLLPLLAAAALLQTTVPLARVATSYQAVDQGMSLASIGLLSSAFALLPVLFVVRIGRYSDRHGEAAVIVTGAALVLAAVLGLWLASGGFPLMLGFTLLLGIGQVMTISALQVATTRCSAPESHDRVLGNFLIATALGHATGPLLLTAVTPTGALSPGSALFPALAGAAVVLMLAAALTALRMPAHIAPPSDEKPPALRAILAQPGMAVTVLASGICLATNDLIMVFLPALAAARGIDAATVGLLLSLRAAASMASRLLFSQLVRRVGRVRLMTLAILAAGLTSLALAASLPVWALALVLATAGYTMGMAIACTISVTMLLAPVSSTATALSLRMTANRVGQFLIPLGAGATAASLGPGSPFIIMGTGLVACA
ncbi:MAG: MFS transporter, partial [Shinella sp.]